MYKVCILMSTYNGEKYIKEQIETLLNQIGVEINILIRDDGSTDRTVEIIKGVQSKYITLIEGNNLGFAQSFWSLLKNDDQFDYYAFCDQDDIWFNDKIISAIKVLDGYEGPALYTSDVITVDENGCIISNNGFGVSGILNYKEALLKSILPGCTFVFNRKLKKQLEKYEGFMISHDWTTYIIASALGEVFFDNISHIYYRIHENNTIGINSYWLNIKKKVHRLIRPKKKNTRSEVAKNIYKYFAELMSSQNKYITYLFATCSENKVSALKILRIKEYRKIDFIFMLLLRRI